MSNSKNNTVTMIIGLLILALLIFYGVYYARNNKMQDMSNTNSEMNNINADVSGAQATDATADASKMQVTRLNEGTGTQEAKAGDMISVNYVGSFEDGKVFDSNTDAKNPFTFTLGAGQVIKGWDVGVLGMKVGEARRLVIPAELAYGAAGYPPVIPANATLVFDVELVSIKN